MNRPHPPASKLLVRALLLSLPVAAAVGLLIAGGGIGISAGLFIWLAAFAGASLLLRAPLLDEAALRGFLDDLAGDAAAELPRFVTITADRQFVEPLDRLKRRLEQLQAEVAARSGFTDQLLDALGDPVLALDAQRRVTHANRAARDLFGDVAVGRELTEVLRHPAVLQAADAVLDGAEVRTVDFQISAPVQRDFAGAIARLPSVQMPSAADDRMADPTVALLAFRDFTEIRRTEQMRADFVANASHEIRTPLATLVGCVETLREAAREDPQAQERFLDLMDQQAGRMTRLVEDLLSLSRIEMNEHSPPTGRVDVRALLARVLDAAALKAEQAGVRLAPDIADALPLVVGDLDELEQVLQNLVDNAIKYGGEGGLVEITAEQTDRRLAASRGPAVRIAVRDHGPGIAREHLVRLTERFYRVDTARSRALGGTGLGLAIVKHIVNRHRGLLTIDSAVGAGSTFTVYLPAVGDGTPRQRLSSN